MQYNTYKQKVDKVVDFFRLLFKHRVKIYIAFAVVMISVVALLVAKGTITSAGECPSVVVYGEELGYSAKAFMSDTHYEYRKVSDKKWTADPPTMPGEYLVRVAARATIGYKYGPEQSFTLQPKPITVTIANGTVVYGEQPTAAADLAYDDTLECSEFIQTKGTNRYEALSTSITIRNRNGDNVNACYIITTAPCDVSVIPRPITVTSGSYEGEYDGQSHNVGNVSIIDGTLCEGHRIVAKDTNYKNVANNLSNVVQFKIFDASGRDQTSNYAVTPNWGTINISPRNITVTSESFNGVYDDKSHTFRTVTLVEGELCAGHCIVAGPSSYRDVVNNASNVIPFKITTASGTDETSNYKVTQSWGTITISPRPITVSTRSYDAVYDGQDHDLSEVRVTSGDLCSGHYIIMSSQSIYRDVVTDATNQVTFQIRRSPYGEDVTHNYSITKAWGKVTISPRKIGVSTQSYNGVYDAQMRVLDKVTLTSGSLCSGHSIWVSQTKIYCDVVTDELNKPTFDIIDSSSEVVTKNYDITVSWGIVNISPKLVHVTTHSKSWDYDGKPHSHPEFTIDKGYGLISGHSMSVKWAKEITQVGSTDNALEFTVTAQESLADVTHNYWIEIVSYGKLTIKPVSNPPGPNPPDGGDGDVNLGYEDNYDDYNIGLSPAFGDGDFETLFIINSNKTGTVYLKQYSYGDYTGSGWKTAQEYDKKLLDYLSAYYLSSKSAENGGAVAAIITITSKYGIYVLPYYASDTYGPVQQSDVIVVGDASYPYKVYYFDSLDGAALPSGVAEFEGLYADFVAKQYLKINSSTKSYMQQIIASQGFNKNDPDVIAKVAKYVQNAATYNLDYDRSLDASADIAVEFLKTYKEGVCQHYATAATMLYRALGIPARYTVGFVGDAVANKDVAVTAFQAHAWVEVYINGIGWMQVEVTGGGAGGIGGSSGGSDVGNQELVIKPTYQSKEYDGKPLYAKNEIEIDSTLAALIGKGYTYKVSVSGTQTAVGIGTSTVTSFRLFDPSNKDVTDEFIITYEKGTLEVVEYLIEIYIYEKQLVYSGSNNGYSKDEYLIKNIPDGIRLVIKDIKISLTNVGSVSSYEINENISEYISFAVYQDGSTKDISASYNLKVVNYADDSSYNVLTVVPREIIVTTGSYTKPYDGKELTDGTYYISYGMLGTGHKLYVEVTGTITTTGTVRNFVNKESLKITDKNGDDVTANYEVTFDLGYLTIK